MTRRQSRWFSLSKDMADALEETSRTCGTPRTKVIRRALRTILGHLAEQDTSFFKAEKVQINVEIDLDLDAQLTKIAEEKGVTRPDVMKKAIELYLERLEEFGLPKPEKLRDASSSKSTRIYIMTEAFYNAICAHRSTDQLTCYTCGRDLKIGDKVVSKTRSGKAQLRHYECAQRVSIV